MEQKKERSINLKKSSKINKPQPKLDRSFDRIKVKPALSDEAMYGFIGEVSKFLSEGNEANDKCIALHIMGHISASIYPELLYKPYGPLKTVARLNAIVVAPSGAGKGISSDQANILFKKAESISKGCVSPVLDGSLSTPEGLAAHLNESENGDKASRLFIVETEMLNIIKKSSSNTSTLSVAIRDLYDGKPLKQITKYNQVGCENPHVAILAHITPSEFINEISDVDISNGFLNRFPIYYSSDRKFIPIKSEVCEEKIEIYSKKLCEILVWANENSRKFECTEEYIKLWKEHYVGLRQFDDAGDVEQNLMTRAAHYVEMYAMVFAATDKTSVLEEKHLIAALKWFEYWNDSVIYIFDTEKEKHKKEMIRKVSDKVYSIIELELKSQKKMGKTPITKKLSGVHSKEEISEAIKYLQETNPPKIRVERKERNRVEISLY